MVESVIPPLTQPLNLLNSHSNLDYLFESRRWREVIPNVVVVVVVVVVFETWRSFPLSFDESSSGAKLTEAFLRRAKRPEG